MEGQDAAEKLVCSGAAAPATPALGHQADLEQQVAVLRAHVLSQSWAYWSQARTNTTTASSDAERNGTGVDNSLFIHSRCYSPNFHLCEE